MAKRVSQSSMTHSPDLVKRCNAGDESAWVELHSKYAPLIKRMVGKYSGSQLYEVEDMVNEVFEKLVTALRSYDPCRPLEGYIVEIARRTRIDFLRRSTATKRAAAGNPGPLVDTHDHSGEKGYVQTVSNESDQESSIIREQGKSYLKEALLKLSSACRELLSMRYQEELSYREISITLSVKETTLRVRAQRCLWQLGKIYKDMTLGISTDG